MQMTFSTEFSQLSITYLISTVFQWSQDQNEILEIEGIISDFFFQGTLNSKKIKAIKIILVKELESC